MERTGLIARSVNRWMSRLEAVMPGRVRSPWNAREAARRERRWASLEGEAESFINWVHPGVRMILHRDSELCRLIYLRSFEFNERLFTKRFLREKDVYVDVGANIGLFTVLAADRVGAAGRVFSFEPVSKTFARLQENIRLNGFRQVSAHQLALSDARGQAEITIAGGGFDAWNSLGRPYMGQEEAREKIQVHCWDEFAAENDLVGKVTMIKIDVEGWEAHVLRGGRQTLSRDDAPTLYVEFTPAAAANAGSSCGELYELLASYGYEMYLPDDTVRSLEPFPPRENYPNVNLLAVKDKDWVQHRLRDG
jgi:FkbM family methyltransferase